MMDVFGAIKKTISNVPQNISAGFKSLTSREDDPEQDTLLRCGGGGVSVDAGAELLNKFQEYWAQIHEDAEGTAKQAEDADGSINKLYLQIERQNDTMSEFLSHVTFLPELVLGLEATMELVGELEGKVTDLESHLLTLEDLCEEQELQNNRAQHLNELKLYRERKSVEIEQVKSRLAREHADKAAAHEKRLQATLQQKQTIFEDTYTEAITDYKLFGQTRLKSPGYMHQSSSSSSPGAGVGAPDLASITLEKDTAALDAFLASSSSSSDTEPAASAEEEHKSAQATDADKDMAPEEACADTEEACAYTEEACADTEEACAYTEEACADTEEACADTEEACAKETSLHLISSDPQAGDANTQAKSQTGDTEAKTGGAETETATEQSGAEENPETDKANNNASSPTDGATKAGQCHGE